MADRVQRPFISSSHNRSWQASSFTQSGFDWRYRDVVNSRPGTRSESVTKLWRVEAWHAVTTSATGATALQQQITEFRSHLKKQRLPHGSFASHSTTNRVHQWLTASSGAAHPV